MTQNIYDDPEFFAAYAGLPRSRSGLDGAPEWPVLRSMLPPLKARAVVDLGCGYGWFCRWAQQQGAARVLGLDVSRRMLARARAAGGSPAILYVCADLECAALAERSVDLVYSSLALHYIAALDRLLGAVHCALATGGDLVFSVEHPVFTAPATAGWSIDAAGGKSWPLQGYLNEGPRRTLWLGKPVLKWHRTIATYLHLLRSSGFAIVGVEEWGPSEEQIAVWPALADERHRPPFLLVAARK